ncbi:MAG: hypothetical protein CVT48_00800 [Thermoplasmata archaeon HGW-Thermoplasmata-1]|nr:MAG: hypothetical protein CVT48_00800 [Thermoplasmata archaeon HGW-Thermoplasmata-1]
MTKNAVVTGGAGFIGSNLVEELLIDGWKVTVFDNLHTGKPENLKGVADRIRFINGDVRDRAALKEAFFGADVVFHLAADISVAGSVKNPAFTNDVNVNGTLNVLLEARGAGVKKVVFASSAAVYGNDPALPKREDMMPRPESPYAVSKVTGEYYCNAFFSLYGMGCVSLRFFNVYGPRQDPESQYAAVVPAFISRALSGGDLVIYGDGRQTRDFVYVKDLARALILSANCSASGVFNIGCGKGISVNELARAVIEKSESRSRVVYRDARAGDVKFSYADVTRAGEALGFAVDTPLEEGIGKTIESVGNIF